MNFVYNVPLFNNKISVPNVQFRANGIVTAKHLDYRKDSFSTNPLYDNFGDKNSILQNAKSNPKIKSILEEYNIPLNINIEELENLKTGHLQKTRITAAKIYSALNPEVKSQVNLSNIQQAAMLHDFGKVLIPKEILNKKGSLNPDEKQIMELHSELGYELLKQNNIDNEVLKLVKYHHQKPDGSGYPQITEDYIPNLDLEILNAADKYSALTENRPYKEALTREEALEIISQDVDNGVISPQIFEALSKAT